jgi:hypothetical protein
MPIENIPSVMEYGILSNKLAESLPHVSVAMESVQQKRAEKKLPDGKVLHDCANVYFHARNPMMYKRRNESDNLCILQVSKEILKIDGVWISDGNAAASAKYVKFCRPCEMDAYLNYEYIFAERWSDMPSFYGSPRKHAKCAEVLVPERIPSEYITGAYVVNESCKQKLTNKGLQKPITIDANLFFK